MPQSPTRRRFLLAGRDAGGRTKGIMEQVKVSLGSESRIVAKELAFEVGDELIKQFPKLAAEHGRPNFELVGTVSDRSDTSEEAPKSSERPKSSGRIAGGSYDVVGAARSETDRQAAIEAGFSPAQPIYRAGTRVVQLGVDNLRASRQAWEKRPLVQEACSDFVAKIEAEQRKNTVVLPGKLRMTATGKVRSPEGDLLVGRSCFSALCRDIGIGKGAAYLADFCEADLRAQNFNRQAVRFAEGQAKLPKSEITRSMLRTRNASKGGREVFGVVSPSYGQFDVDTIARALGLASPQDARVQISYDGTKARFVIGWHSDVAPEHAVAGEFFKASVVVTTDDTGGGSIKLSAAIEQNLCLNLIVIDFAEIETARIRHVGNFNRLAGEFGEGFGKAMGKVKHFRKAWGFAVEQDVIDLLPAKVQEDVRAGMPVSKALPGLFNGLIERELLPISGERKVAVSGLLKAWDEDTSAARVGRPAGELSLASVINAATRYAHTNDLGMGDEDAIERAAGRLLGSLKDSDLVPVASLPYEAIEL